jgi:hypothetical protein
LNSTSPLAIDLFCGLGGWTEGFLAEGYRVVGFDIERHDYGTGGYPGQLVLQDIRTLHGKQFKDAAIIVASPPCQKYSYMAMPWKRAKALIAWYEESPERRAELNELFDACFRIQREAIEASGRHIPLIVENVRGAQRWVGESAWNFGSYYLWGDVPALMPIPGRIQKFNPDGTAHPPGSWFAVADSKNRGVKGGGQDWSKFNKTGEVSPHWNVEAVKVASQSARRTDVGKGARFTSRDCGVEGNKIGGDWFSDPNSTCRRHGSKSKARKAASAQIAKIPFALARHIAKTYHP